MAEDPDSKVNVDEDNYGEWTWKQIKAAICGSYGKGADDSRTAMLRVSDPQSLLNAASEFDSVRQTLEKFVGDASKWTEEVVGKNGSWTGLGAKGFATMVDNIIGSAQSLQTALEDTPTYFTSLSDAARGLQKAINDIEYADHWAAKATITRYYHELKNNWWLTLKSVVTHSLPNPPWTTMPDGTVVVAVSTYPDIVADLTSQMVTAIQTLAGVYKMRIADLRKPDEVDITPPEPENQPQPKLTFPKIDMPKIDMSKLKDLGGPGGLKPSDLPGLDGPPGGDNLLDTPDLNGSDLNGSGLDGTGLDKPNLDQLTTSGLPPLGSDPTGRLTHALTSGLKSPNDLKLPPVPTLDPTTHLAGLNAPNLSQLADGLRLPGADDLKRGALSAFPLDSLSTPSGKGLSPSGLSSLAPFAPYGAPGRFTNLSSGGGPGAAALAAEEKALAQRGPGPAGMGGMGGMPYPPPMAGRNGKEQERERNTWLQEDEDVWGANPDVGPAFLGADLDQD